MKLNKLIFGFITSFIITSCIVYHPHTVDIPLISKKNDLRIDAGVSLIPSAHSTVSCGLTKKVAVQGYGSIGSDERYYFQLATGLYKNRGNSRILEFYGGYGLDMEMLIKVTQEEVCKVIINCISGKSILERYQIKDQT